MQVSLDNGMAIPTPIPNTEKANPHASKIVKYGSRSLVTNMAG